MDGGFGEVLVLDWGLAVLAHPGKDVTASPAGTPSYMAPEMFTPPYVMGPRSDVYLLGLVAVDLLVNPDRASQFARMLAMCICDPEGFDTRSNAMTQGDLATVIFSIGAAAVVAGTVTWLTSPSGDDSAKPEESTEASLQWSLSATPQGPFGTVTLSW